MKLIVLILAALVLIAGLRVSYTAYYGSTTEAFRPLMKPLAEEARPDLLNLDKEVLVDLIYENAESDIAGMKNYNELMDANSSVYKVLMWFLAAQFILTVLATALNKPLLWIRKKTLSKE